MSNSEETRLTNFLENPKCRFFNGYRSCHLAKKYKVSCPCKYCQPIGKRLLIMEMGGLGSVLRTTVVTKEFKKIHNVSHITFLTHKGGAGLLQFSPSIDRVLIYDVDSFGILLAEKFDYIYNFEVGPEASSLCSVIESKERYGFGWNENGLPKLMNPLSINLFRFQIDDRFREVNQKPIQQLLLESVGLKWKQQTMDIELKNEDIKWVESFFKKNGLDKFKIIGLNIGSKKEHAQKRWSPGNFIELAKKLNKIEGVKPIILGGPEEPNIYKFIMSEIKDEHIPGNNCQNSFGEFMALLKRCEVIVSATTFGLVAAIGLGVKTVAVCSPKPIVEIYTYGKGIKIAHTKKYDPNYSTKIKDFSKVEELEIGIKEIPVEMVYDAILDSLKNDFSHPVRFVKRHNF